MRAYLIEINYYENDIFQYNEIRCAFSKYYDAKKFLKELAEEWSEDGMYSVEKRAEMLVNLRSNDQRYQDMTIMITDVPLF